MKIVTNNNYCVKCHLVGDYTPPGCVKALAPQLPRAHARLRPGYGHDWIANPKRFLPYTGMPVHIPFDQPVSQVDRPDRPARLQGPLRRRRNGFGP